MESEYICFDEVMSYFCDKDLDDLEVFNHFDFLNTSKENCWKLKNTSVFLSTRMDKLLFVSKRITICHRIIGGRLILFNDYCFNDYFNSRELDSDFSVREVIESFDSRDQKYIIRNIDILEEMFSQHLI